MTNQPIEIGFDRGEADRRVAGIAAAARIVRSHAERGVQRIMVSLPEGRLEAATWRDLERICPGIEVDVADRPGAAATRAPRLDTFAILRSAAKPSDGLVSRWLNRPVSRLISAALLRLPGLRPMHATLGTALLAVAMFASLLLGGEPGLVAGGLLFHAASVFDGVDGELARATFRTSRLGALLDGVIDMGTNVLFILGVTLNLSARNELALSIGSTSLLIFLLGLVAISRTATRSDRPFSMDLVKQRYRARHSGPAFARLTGFLTVVSSRDFFALLFAVLILVGLPMVVLYLFAAAAVVWILFVIGALIVPVPASSIKGSA